MRSMAFEPFSDVRGGPAIIVGSRDLRSLRAVVERHAGGPGAAFVEQLDAELQRAIVLPQPQVPGEIVGIGSRVTFEDLGTGSRREVVLALPDEVGTARDRLSVLSPLAIALLGAAAGETVVYALSGGGMVEVRILSVTGGAVMTKELLVIDGSDGTFDVAAAMRAAAAVRAQAGRARVKLDLCRARVEDAALAAFVREVAGRPVSIVGLSRHHERLLRYLDEGAGAEERA
jgi:regulator of nucleoside diphosphate kinase